MKTRTLLLLVFFSTAVVLAAASAHADDLSSAIAPVEAAYCREKFPAIGEGSDPLTSAGPILGQRSIDVYQTCNDDPLKLEEVLSQTRLTRGNIFGAGE